MKCHSIAESINLEDVRIWAGESPDELMEHLHALANHCNFPTDDERSIMYSSTLFAPLVTRI